MSNGPLVYIQMIAMLSCSSAGYQSPDVSAVTPHASFHDTVTSFSSGGWSNLGVAVQVGQISNVYALTYT